MPKYTNTDEYIKAQPKAVAEQLTAIRELFHNAIPGTKESIRYDMPAFTVGDYHLYMAGYKNHIGMYPVYGIDALQKEMQPYRGKDTKDAIHFKHNEPLPLELIRKSINIRYELT